MSKPDVDDLLAKVRAALLFRGALATDTACRMVEHLLGTGSREAQFARLVDQGVEMAWFDRPQPGAVRAIAADASDYTANNWRRAVEEAISSEWMRKVDVLHAAALWAKDAAGLRFAGLTPEGSILRALEVALQRLVAEGRVDVHANGSLRRAGTPDPGLDQSHSLDLRRVQELRVWLAIAVAGIDGLVHAEEESLVLDQANRNGVERERAHRYLQRYRHSDADVIPILDEIVRLTPLSDRAPILTDMIQLAEVDGILTPSEIRVLEEIAAHLDVPFGSKA